MLNEVVTVSVLVSSSVGDRVGSGVTDTDGEGEHDGVSENVTVGVAIMTWVNVGCNEVVIVGRSVTVEVTCADCDSDPEPGFDCEGVTEAVGDGLNEGDGDGVIVGVTVGRRENVAVFSSVAVSEKDLSCVREGCSRRSTEGLLVDVTSNETLTVPVKPEVLDNLDQERERVTVT